MRLRPRSLAQRSILALASGLLLTSCCSATDELRTDVSEHDARIEDLQAQVDDLRATNAELEERVAELETQQRRRTPRTTTRTRSGRIEARCQESDGQYTFPDLETLDASALAYEARVIPHYESGEPVGFKLYSIRDDSLLRSCGFQSADIIRSVNDLAITDPESALEAYATLREVDELTFEIERGSSITEIRIATE